MKKLLLLLFPAALLADVFYTKPISDKLTVIDGVASSASVDAALALKQPIEDQRLSTTNSPKFTGLVWRYTVNGTNYLKEVTVNTNGAFEATTVNE